MISSADPVDITPKGVLIRALRAQFNMALWKLYAELIDNAQDAGATNVWLDFSTKDVVVIEDDGNGCDDVSCFFRIGDRHEHDTTTSGRHAIGGKEAMFCLGNTTEVVSRRNGIERRLMVNWKDIEKCEGHWFINGVVEQATEHRDGTTIEIRDLLKPRPVWKSFEDQLGSTYMPALSSGKFLIHIRRDKKKSYPIQARRLPLLENEEEDTLDFGEGKKAVVRMGLIKEAACRPMEGVWLALPGRILEEKTRIGIGTDEPTPSLYGFVVLHSKKWSVSKNKDFLSANDKSLLNSAIALRFQRLIDKSKKSSQQILLNEVNQTLGLMPLARERERDRERKKKARRSPKKNETGTIQPTGLGAIHNQAEKTQPGNRFLDKAGKSMQGALRIMPENATAEQPLLRVDATNTVYYNRDNEVYLRMSREPAHQEILVYVILAFYASYKSFVNRQPNLPKVFESDSLEELHKTLTTDILRNFLEAKLIYQESATEAG